MSWYQTCPTVSIELVDWLGVPAEACIVDVGGGASSFAATMSERGHADVTVLDLSGVALATAAAASRHAVSRLEQDVLTWEPERRYNLWHDRAVFHFLTDPDDRASTARCSMPRGTPAAR